MTNNKTKSFDGGEIETKRAHWPQIQPFAIILHLLGYQIYFKKTGLHEI
jgi:hypothetical protein